MNHRYSDSIFLWRVAMLNSLQRDTGFLSPVINFLFMVGFAVGKHIRIYFVKILTFRAFILAVGGGRVSSKNQTSTPAWLLSLITVSKFVLVCKCGEYSYGRVSSKRCTLSLYWYGDFLKQQQQQQQKQQQTPIQPNRNWQITKDTAKLHACSCSGLRNFPVELRRHHCTITLIFHENWHFK